VHQHRRSLAIRQGLNCHPHLALELCFAFLLHEDFVHACEGAWQLALYAA
jgi:hypothetical protein